MTIEARLLGPVTLVADGASLNAGGAKYRALLAALLLSPGQPVAVEQLVLDIWGESASVRARAQLHSLVSRMRAQLRVLDSALAVKRHVGLESYSLEIAPDSVDSIRFRALTARAREALADGRPGEAADLLDRALECWSGPALSGVRTHGRLEAERSGLEELRLEALALRNDADLRMDRPTAALPGLRALVAEFPGHKRFRDQLAEALERSGQVAQAWELRQERLGRPAERAAVGPVEVASGESIGRSTAVAAQPVEAPASGTSAADVPRISLLGPVRAWLGEIEVPLGSPQQRAVLGILAAQVGQRVSTQELVEGVWGDRPPPQAIAAARTYVSRLRTVLEPAREVRRPAVRLVSVSDGYALLLPKESVDLHVFEDRLTKARSAQRAGEHAAAVRAAEAALDLWRGSEALEVVFGPHAEMLRYRMGESRIAAYELRFTSQLELGGGVEAIAELSQLVSQHPLRERLRELLMVALYRAGRRAEALGVYTDTRKLLIDELGVEPGAGLAAVHARVLAGDPTLLEPAKAPHPTGPVTSSALRPPAQLPADVADFTGNDVMVDDLGEALRGASGLAVQVQVLCGIGGVGKTTLAVHVAHSVRSDFPDGQLYADLRGTGTNPADPAAVLGDFLYALGVQEAPDSLEQRAALFRSMLADRRMLVVLDNARDVKQVRPLIPGVSGSAVLVTSRSRLVGVAGASVWDVEEMTPRDALALFTTIVGEARVTAEPEAAVEVVVACGFLPLAVRIAAARLASRPRWSVADLTRRLADQRRRLDELQFGGLAVGTTMGLGYDQLSSEEARAFRLLSLIDTPDLPLPAVAALLGVDEDRAEDLAESLVEANMLEAHTPGRYRLHDLLRLYAQGENQRIGDAEQQKAAMHRLLDLLLATVRGAVRELDLGDELPEPLYDPPVPALALEDGSRGIREWLNSTRLLTLDALDAAFSWAGLPHPAVDLIVELTESLEDWGATRRLRSILDSAASVPLHQGDLALLARLRYVQGILCSMAGEFQEAEAAYRESLALLWPEDVTRMRALVSHRLALTLSIAGRSEEALLLYQSALEISRSTGTAVIEIRILANMASEYRKSGQPESGLQCAQAAVEAARAASRTDVLAQTLYQLGVLLDATGASGEAVNRLSEALTLYRSEQNQLWEGYTLARLAACLLAVGRDQDAVDAGSEALALGQELDAPYCQGLAGAALGEALLRLGQSTQGLARLEEAHSVFLRLGVAESVVVSELLWEVAAMVDDRWRWYPPEVRGWLGALWGKSAGRAGGTANLLLSHMLDTAAVAEFVWDDYLPQMTRGRLDTIAGGSGKGRRLFAWLCGIHDCGKATPAFQRLDAAGEAAVRKAGLSWDKYAVNETAWRHDKAGGRLLRAVLDEADWAEEQVDWVWPLVAGHHGMFPTLGQLRPRKEDLQGKGASWKLAQSALVEVFSREIGYQGESPLAAVEPALVPSRAVQLQLSGYVVMADWIASDERYFTGVADLTRVTMAQARQRAEAAWSRLELRGGWGAMAVPGPEVIRDRFGHDPRPSQGLVLDVVRRMGGPGLVIVEAPMGEGKTKAALAAAELLAARYGLDGVFLGMPTQATADPMFTQLRSWLREVGDGLEDQVTLLHGKRMFNKEWRGLLEGAGEWGQHSDDPFASVGEDEFGMRTDYFEGYEGGERRAPAEWFLGRRRGLLSPFAIGTVDQMLYAATRTEHVMLRMAGLVGKVVILDEVHTADVYMSQFLSEGLWWLGQAGVPVVLLSAALPPDQRRRLVAAYLAGTQSAEAPAVLELPEPQGYPSVTAAWWGPDGSPELLVETTRSWRDDLQVQVEVLDEPSTRTDSRVAENDAGPADAAVVDYLKERLVNGGCVLVIRNTVARAQTTFDTLRAEFGADVRLLHGRLHAGHQADRTQEVLKLLGPPAEGSERPDRLIVVATQLAEQSFDVDADLLITDLAPMDLLLQRIGRLHRHDGVRRPSLMSRPTVVVTGIHLAENGAPQILGASEGIYGRYLLLRTAAEVERVTAGGGTWSIPGQVPDLVARVYGTDPVILEAWGEAEAQARREWEKRQAERRAKAAEYVLTPAGEHGSQTLAGLHFGNHGSLAEGQFEALVRDGDRSVEVVLARRTEHGVHAMTGRRLGPNGEVTAELLDDVLCGTVRLPTCLTVVAEQTLGPLPGWRDHPWLRYSRALELDENGDAVLGDFQLCYDDLLGLVVSGGRLHR
ncbi:CRISPR-associated helicase Cas3' [Kitasatospora sp. NPDC096140]|uniref:CRISPR-associated helicase Cas3' n=1 Tax=Kitasatospora sp. NPDC096140 TaxID=3155425 RepID=UPI00332CDDBB